VDAHSRTLPLYFLEPGDLADGNAFARAHLGAAIERHGRGSAGFLSAFQPIALLGATSRADLLDPRAITCLLDADGEMLAVPGPRSAEVHWVGYLDDVLDMLGK
jgi:hypothetical protein